MESLPWPLYLAVLCAATVQASYLLQAIDTTTYATWRVWYGDGELTPPLFPPVPDDNFQAHRDITGRAYTGSTIPPDVKAALNFTSKLVPDPLYPIPGLLMALSLPLYSRRQPQSVLLHRRRPRQQCAWRPGLCQPHFPGRQRWRCGHR